MRNVNKILILLNFGSDPPGLMRSLEVSAGSATLKLFGGVSLSHQACGGWTCLDAALGIIILTIAFSGCSGGNASRAYTAPSMVSQKDRAASDQNTLSREHTIAINLPESDLGPRFSQVTDRCSADSAHGNRYRCSHQNRL
jgi:hypothetical protein